MKSATTSLHRTLARHPDVFLPESEVYFFDLDDASQGSDFLPVGRWAHESIPDFNRHLDTYLDWYSSLFDDAGEGQVIGEDSTTYLASDVAPGRVREILPDVRLVFLLRDPVTRAYSHYWHLVRTGRAVFDFEYSLRLAPETMLERGRYRRHFERWLSEFPREQMLILLFEDFVADPHPVVDDCCRFIGVEPFEQLPSTSLHENRDGPLLGHRFNLLFNAVVGHRLPNPSTGNPLQAESGGERRGSPSGGTRAALKRLRARLMRPYPPMAEDTRRALEAYYRLENDGLSDLIGIDVGQRWPYMAQGAVARDCA